MNTLQTVCAAFLVTASGCGKLSKPGSFHGNHKTYTDVVECTERSVAESIQDSTMNVDTTQELISENEQLEYEKRRAEQYDLQNDTSSTQKKLITEILCGLGLDEISIKMPSLDTTLTDDSETMLFILPGGKEIAFYPTLFSIQKEGTIYRISKFGLQDKQNDEEGVIEYMIALPETILINEGMLDLLSDSTYDSTALHNRKQSDIKSLLKILGSGYEVTEKSF